MQATYTLRKAADGRSHFARVTVVRGQATSRDECGDISPEWRDAASKGIQFALRESGSNTEVSILNIQGTLADTSDSAVFVAAAIATFRLNGDSRHSERFADGQWHIEVTRGAVETG